VAYSEREVSAKLDERLLWQSEPSLIFLAISNVFLLLFGLVWVVAFVAIVLFVLGSAPLPDLNWGAVLLAAILLGCGSMAGWTIARFALLLLYGVRGSYSISANGLSCTNPVLWGYPHATLSATEMKSWEVFRGTHWGARGTIHLRQVGPGPEPAVFHIKLTGSRNPEVAMELLQMLKNGALLPYPR